MKHLLKKNLSTIVLCLMLLAGLCLLLYPTLSNYWNSFHQSKTIASYAEKIAQMDDGESERIWKEAEIYNRKLLEAGNNNWKLSKEEEERYNSILDVSGTGIMGYIEIPSIKVSIPIYHGVSEAVLQVAVGHLPGSGFPVGGRGNHCALSGHRGLPSALLFTNLDRLVVGDIFIINVLDQTLTYEVDQISIVEPDDASGLSIEKDQDLCTLITCTPYGVNSHRLLVRGHRTENLKEAVRVTADGVQINTKLVALVIAVPVIVLLFFFVLIFSRKKG
ncbi:MAG: class C sortase [Lachnospiraceae bacterium]|nr:class C sortase [Lachnospiraceae bacterium]